MNIIKSYDLYLLENYKSYKDYFSNKKIDNRFRDEFDDASDELDSITDAGINKTVELDLEFYNDITAHTKNSLEFKNKIELFLYTIGYRIYDFKKGLAIEIDDNSNNPKTYDIGKLLLKYKARENLYYVYSNYPRHDDKENFSPYRKGGESESSNRAGQSAIIDIALFVFKIIFLKWVIDWFRKKSKIKKILSNVKDPDERIELEKELKELNIKALNVKARHEKKLSKLRKMQGIDTTDMSTKQYKKHLSKLKKLQDRLDKLENKYRDVQYSTGREFKDRSLRRSMRIFKKSGFRNRKSLGDF